MGDGAQPLAAHNAVGAAPPRPADGALSTAVTVHPVRGAPDAKTPPADGVAVSIVSDSALLRAGLVAVLHPHLPLHVAGSYAGAPRAMAGLANPPGHVVLLDGGLPPAMTDAWIRFWRGLTPPALVLVLDVPEDADTIVRCIEAGAGGFTPIGASAADVAEAIGWISRGGALCPPQLAGRLFARLAAWATEAPAVSRRLAGGLTEREREVLQYINEDCSNDEIARRLFIEVRTVKHHVHNILQKLKLRHRWDAARLAVDRGWLEPRPARPEDD